MDLGDLAVPDFRDDDESPPRFSLDLVRCVACGLVQLAETAPREVLYTDGYGFYSGVNERTRSELERIALRAPDNVRRWQSHPRWLDIGCNDGTLLSFVPEYFERVGVDPVAKFAELAEKHADEVHVGLFSPDLVGDELFDVITSIAMFYDLDDPDAFIEDVKSILTENGVWVVQQNDLGSMLETNAVDNVSHEHLTYWSLTTFDQLLRRHGFYVLDVDYSDLNGGCMRCFIVRDEFDLRRSHRVERWLSNESNAGLRGTEAYQEFARRARGALDDLGDAVQSAHRAGDEIFIYGASNRGSTLWQASHITPYVTCAVERNPDKVGRRFSSVGVPIISEEKMRENPPPYLLVGPWWFKDMFAERESDYLRAGGALIIPLPQVEVITA
jgi:SAM-dependent methyltransferase